jgi:predicted nucleotidyltransferase component of viral defense system
MIPAMNIVAWGRVVPWADQRQIEQDLIISRALIEIFSDPFLRERLRFRGGTALNKLHFPSPLRYSEDIDLVRTEASGIGEVLDRLRAVLEPWLGRARFIQSPVAPKLRFTIQAETGEEIRLKIEINTWEIEAYDGPLNVPLRVENPWFSGEAAIPTFSHEEMLATKLRAFLQRDKGRDLLDLAHALEVFDTLNTARIAECFVRYLEHSNVQISRANAEQRLFAKLNNPGFVVDIRPLITPSRAGELSEDWIKRAFAAVLQKLIATLPGDPWQRTPEMIEHFGLPIDTPAG